MRTNIIIDDDLMRAAREATGLRTKKAVVEEALKRVVKCKEQADAIRALKGAADWQGDLRKMRADRDLTQW